MGNAPVKKANSQEQRLIELQQARDSEFIDSLKPFANESQVSLFSLGTGNLSNNQGLAGGNFLPISGGVMGGPIAFNPLLAEIFSNEIDVANTTGLFTGRIILGGEGGDQNDILERITGNDNQMPGRMLSLQGITGETITFKHQFNGGGGGDIRTPTGLDFVLNGENNVTLIYDAINDEWAFMDGGILNQNTDRIFADDSSVIVIDDGISNGRIEFTTDATLLMTIGIVSAVKTIDLKSSELTNFNVLRSTANKAIDSVSGGWNYDTTNTTDHTFRVHNGTIFVDVGSFVAGGLDMEDLNISNVSGINFSNTGVSINDGSTNMNFGVPANNSFIFTSGAGPVLTVVETGGQKTINLNSSELLNFNVLFSGASGTNKKIDSVSGGYNFDTPFTTVHQFRVRNSGDTAFDLVGHFLTGGLNMDDQNISNVSGINFSNTGVSINDASSDMNFGVATDQEFIFTSGAGIVLRTGTLSAVKTIDLVSSEIINFNILRVTTNKQIDSVSGGWLFDTPNTTEFNFRVRNAGDTAWVLVGTFDEGGFKGENLPIAEIFSISFTNAGAISNSATDMTLGIGAGDTFRNTIGGFLELELNASKLDIDAKYLELESIASPGVTGSATTGRMFMDSGNSNRLSIIRNGSVIDLETSSVGALDDLTDVIITSPANNEVLAFDGISTWINQTADQAQLVTINTTQTISGLKTFSANVSINSGNQLNMDGGTGQSYITEDAGDNMEFHVDTTDFFEFFAAEGDSDPIIRIESDGTIKWVPDGHEITTQGGSLDLGVELTTHAFIFKVDVSATPEDTVRIEDDLFRIEGDAFQTLEMFSDTNAANGSSIAELAFFMNDSGGSKQPYATIAGVVHDASITLGAREGALHFLVTHGAANSAIYVIEGGESNTTSRIGWYDKATNPAVQQTLPASPTATQISTVLRNYGLTKL